MVEENETYNEQNKLGSLFIEDIDRIDCAIFDPSMGIVGQSWHVDIEVEGQLDENGFVCDFSRLKKLVKATLSNSLDHALLIPIMSKHVHFQQTDAGELWNLKAKTKLTGVNSDWVYECPKGAVYPVRAVKITRDILEQECAKKIRHRLDTSIQRVHINLRAEQTPSSDAYFRYTHGITHHDGLCQRLFHGHRSRIEVYVADERRTDLEQYVAHDLLGSIVHVAAKSQVIEGNFEEIARRGTTNEPVCLAYEAHLGKYKATLPSNRVFLVENETSIERISQALALHLAEKIKHSAPVKVKCFEGIGKGAVAEA